MSRLEEELKEAFRRQPPPPDFVARLMARLETEQEEKRRKSWRSWFQFPALKWAVAAAMAVVLAVSLWQWRRVEPAAAPPNIDAIAVNPAPPATPAPETLAPPAAAESVKAGALPVAHPRPKPRRAARPNAAQLAEARRREQLRKEGEAAVEKLKLALAIASASLNEARRGVQADD